VRRPRDPAPAIERGAVPAWVRPQRKRFVHLDPQTRALCTVLVCLPQRIDHLEPEQIVGLQLGQHPDHAFRTALVELSDHVRPNVRWALQQPKQVRAHTSRQTSYAAHRVHDPRLAQNAVPLERRKTRRRPTPLG
jgi:hypothetical protein